MKNLFLILIFTIPAYLSAKAQDEIPDKDAGKYIGHTKMVMGFLYRQEIRSVKSSPDSIMIVCYMGQPGAAEPDFVEVMKLRVNGNANEAYFAHSFKPIPYNPATMKGKSGLIAAKGKIVLFEGKPAIITDINNFIILEPVD